ncbi:unknown protein [Cronobacter turicensis z3032]|uniref:Uncharacterized protein n=1 Tax=Cronobacter turicensis (strain DSM 18703 / CCUG 55852 / LMG 23827 / z3032) TaxID=693216 RepID=C9XVD6_CROTZ|nr:unknown protein [Cronobacter turicensis z3032]
MHYCQYSWRQPGVIIFKTRDAACPSINLNHYVKQRAFILPRDQDRVGYLNQTMRRAWRVRQQRPP